MPDSLVGFAWLADVDSPAKRSLLGTLALHAGLDTAGSITVESLAEGAAMSVRTCRTHLHELASAGWLTWARQRSSISGRYQPTDFTLGYPFTATGPSANMSGSELSMASSGKYSSIQFDPQRVNPSWAWHVDVPSASHRVVLASVVFLSDHRGVYLAPKATIADRSLFSAASTIRVLNDLEIAGWIGRETRRRGACTAEGRLHLTRDFMMNAAPSQMSEVDCVAEWPANQEPVRELTGLPRSSFPHGPAIGGDRKPTN